MTLPMALMDFVPVLFFGAAWLILYRDLKNKLNLCAGLLLPLGAQGGTLMVYPCEQQGEIIAEHLSDSLWWRIEECMVRDVRCYLTRVCVADPGRQIGKAASDWGQNILSAEELAGREPQASLIINGSGYVTRTYPWIPENYPGQSEDYYFTPLGSVTVTDGEVFRCLTDVPYYGLTLNADGLNLHIGTDPAQVIAAAPAQTWSFYVECPVIAEHRSILDPAWRFTTTRAMRNIICRLDAHNYLILTVTRQRGGLTMQQCVDYLLAEFSPEWAYNLDGGPSAALMYRDAEGVLNTVWQPGQRNVDVLTFSELPD